jgi:hypothetical protein
MALLETEIIRLDALIRDESKPVNPFEQRILDILSGAAVPKNVHEYRLTAVALAIQHSWWQLQASMLNDHISMSQEPQDDEGPLNIVDYASDDLESYEPEPTRGPSLIDRLRNAELQEARSARRGREFGEKYASESWYAEALERTYVLETDEEVNDGVPREVISLRAPLIPDAPSS